MHDKNLFIYAHGNIVILLSEDTLTFIYNGKNSQAQLYNRLTKYQT